MNISEKFGLNVRGHEDITFIDINLKDDTKLYLDPYVIQAMQNDFCKECQKAINSIFREIFIACSNKDKSRLLYLLSHVNEPNETNLGMRSWSESGKGNDSKTLSKLFLDFYKKVRRNPHFEENPLPLCMYIQNFAEDKMSDLVTNIIRNLLYTFTLKQCTKHNIPISDKEMEIGYYWDSETLAWKMCKGRALVVDGKMYLLVPKMIARKKYMFNIECYIKQYVLSVIQQNHLDNRSELCTEKQKVNGDTILISPPKKLLYEREIKGNNHKDYALEYSKGNSNCEQSFIRDINFRIKTGYGKLSDYELDNIVYKNKRKSA